MFNFLVSLFIFLSSSAYIMGKGFGDVQLGVFKIGTLILWLVGLSLPAYRRVKNVWFNVLVGYCLINTLLLQGQPQLIALEPLLCVFLALILYYTLSEHLETIKPILNGICATIGIQAIIILLQATGYDPICLNDGGFHNTHMVGLFGLKYVLGAWMAIATPILLFNKRWIFGILSALLAFCSFSFASVGILVIVLVWGIYKLKNNKLWLIIPAILCLLAISFLWFYKPYYTAWIERDGIVTHEQMLHPKSLQYKIKSRIHLQSKFLPILFQKPATGFGLGSFKYIGPQIVNPTTDRYGTMTDAWLDYLEQGIQLGLPFIALFVWLCIDTIKRLKYVGDTHKMLGIFCSLLVVPLSMLFHDCLNHASINVLIISIFAAFAIKGACYGETIA